MTGVPATHDLAVLHEAATHCERCDLYRIATQVVFGEGPPDAWVMFVGEQPGDREDREGRPFVGPAGVVLDRALDDLSLDRGEVYVTNAVKHFRWEQRGKRRLHKTPSTEHVRACRPWLEAELDAVDPAVLVVLGAVAARSLLGSRFRLTVQRGQVVPGPGTRPTVATIHPSAVLRSDDREKAYEGFLADLRVAHALRPSRPTP